MKKMLLTAACLFIASQASALSLTGITMDFYDSAGYSMGYHTTVTGSIDTTAVTGNLVGDLLLFGQAWSADVVWASGSAGANTWSGINALPGTHDNSYSYNFNMVAGDVAVGLFADWASNLDIPVLAVFRPNGDGSMSWVDQVWTDNYGDVGTGMQTGPFPRQFPAFSAAFSGPGDPVPEPGTMLLFGTGLVGGMIGLGRGRRRRP